MPTSVGTRRPDWLYRAAPSWLVAVAVYGGFGLTTWFYTVLPWWLLLPARGGAARLARLAAARGGA